MSTENRFKRWKDGNLGVILQLGLSFPGTGMVEPCLGRRGEEVVSSWVWRAVCFMGWADDGMSVESSEMPWKGNSSCRCLKRDVGWVMTPYHHRPLTPSTPPLEKVYKFSNSTLVLNATHYYTLMPQKPKSTKSILFVAVCVCGIS